MDFVLTPELTFLLCVEVFWIGVYVLSQVSHLNKHGLDVQPSFFMYKLKALNSFLDKAANND